MRYVTASQMKEIDRRATEEFGIASIDLMEAAGKAVADEAVKMIGNCDVAVFCGFGNNGGDGLVAARYLAKKGCRVGVYFAGKPRSLSPQTNKNLEALLSMKINPSFLSKGPDLDRAFLAIKPKLIIDAVFGIGIKGRLDPFYEKLFDAINRSGAVIVSVDVPSGLDADTGKPLGAAVRAAVTVTFGCPKSGFGQKGSTDFTGRVVVADIGFPKEILSDGTRTTIVKAKTIKLRSGKKGGIKPGHPWIFKGQFLPPAATVKPGDIITLLDPDGKFAGRGYYNPHSDISIRLLTFRDEPIDRAFFAKSIRSALEKRKGLLSRTDAYRAVFSESDGLCGLIVDVYGKTVVFQCLTLGMEKLKSQAVASISEVLSPGYMYEKSVSPFRALEGLEDVRGWIGPKGQEIVEIKEGQARYLVDIVHGHKTGFYLDQRRSRLAVDGMAKGRKTLDVFCYTGAFSVSCALAGASGIVAVDAKEEALELGRRNAELNGVSDKIEFRRMDAFDCLRAMIKSGEKFDMVIIDPPSFLKTRSSIKMASRGYEELNTMAMKVLNDSGVLATFSCSHNMPNDLFSGILKKSAQAALKRLTIIKRCHQDIDHPIARAIPQTEYLKGYFLKIENRE